VVTVDEVQQLLALGHEIRSFEVKGPGSLNDKAYCAKVARAAMPVRVEIEETPASAP